MHFRRYSFDERADRSMKLFEARTLATRLAQHHDWDIVSIAIEPDAIEGDREHVLAQPAQKFQLGRVKIIWDDSRNPWRRACPAAS